MDGAAETLNITVPNSNSCVDGAAETLRSLALEDKRLNCASELNTSKNDKVLLNLPQVVDGGCEPSSPRNTKRLQASHSAPFSPTRPEVLDRLHSRSLEVLSVEEEQLSDDDDDEDALWGQQQTPNTRV